MTSRQRLGLILVVLGAFFLLNNLFPHFIKEIIQVISVPVILIVIGLYLFLFKK